MRVQVIADAFPPYRQVSGLTDVDFSTEAEARAAIRAEFPRAKSRPTTLEQEDVACARYRVSDGDVLILWDDEA